MNYWPTLCLGSRTKPSNQKAPKTTGPRSGHNRYQAQKPTSTLTTWYSNYHYHETWHTAIEHPEQPDLQGWFIFCSANNISCTNDFKYRIPGIKIYGVKRSNKIMIILRNHRELAYLNPEKTQGSITSRHA